MADKSVIQMTEYQLNNLKGTAGGVVASYQRYAVVPPSSEEVLDAHAAGWMLGFEMAVAMILYHGNCKFEKGDSHA